MHSGYDAGRVAFTIRQLRCSAPGLPIVLATPHVDESCGADLVIDCRRMLRDHRLVECGIMGAAFHPAMDHLDIDLVTADTLVLRDPRQVMPTGTFCAPQQHLPVMRPFGDWFVHLPALHKARREMWRFLLEDPSRQAKFDRYFIQACVYSGGMPQLLHPPVIINGEWIMRDWKPWSQPVTSETAAVHPLAGKKFPELLSEHEFFAHAAAVVRERESAAIERSAVSLEGIPKEL